MRGPRRTHAPVRVDHRLGGLIAAVLPHRDTLFEESETFINERRDLIEIVNLLRIVGRQFPQLRQIVACFTLRGRNCRAAKAVHR